MSDVFPAQEVTPTSASELSDAALLEDALQAATAAHAAGLLAAPFGIDEIALRTARRRAARADLARFPHSAAGAA